MNIKYTGSLLFIGLLSMLSADEIKGFRDLKWGDPSSKLKDANCSTYSNEITCKVINEDYKIGSSIVEDISYSFYKNKFWKITASYSHSRDNRQVSLFSDFEFKYSLKLAQKTTSSYNHRLITEKYYYGSGSTYYSGTDQHGHELSGRWSFEEIPGIGAVDHTEYSGSLSIESSAIANEIAKIYREEEKKG